eukprot:Hpha_TRINITY_DN16642_c1_g1::TRINITY_DN16642_c1_g1_i2::g.180031::m.180031/K10396/KIF5; kinesin family member 5
MAQENVRVVARLRPADDSCLTAEGGSVKVQSETQERLDKRYNFDRVYTQDAKQQDVFEDIGKRTVAKALEGFNGTVFAYGQTGSGKTHSMLGPGGGRPECLDPSNPLYAERGLIPRMVEDLFRGLIARQCESFAFSVTCHVYEIYNEELIDLLAIDAEGPREALRLEGARETFRIRGLVEISIADPSDLLRLIADATAKRHMASTAMNDRSSRSHTVVQINVWQADEVQATRITSQLNLVDLAGSERVGKTHATGKTAHEGTRINLSLTTLGKVITQLCKMERHISFRDSLLTRVLQNSLGGNALTTLVCAMSPLLAHQSETLSTLRFAESAKLIRNKARVNVQRSADEWEMLCKQKDDEIASLIQKLEMAQQHSSQRRHSAAATADQSAFQEQLEEATVRLEAALAESDGMRKALEASERVVLERTRQVQFLERGKDAREAEHQRDLADLRAVASLNDTEVKQLREENGKLEIDKLETMKNITELQIQVEQFQADITAQKAAAAEAAAAASTQIAILTGEKTALNKELESVKVNSQQERGVLVKELEDFRAQSEQMRLDLTRSMEEGGKERGELLQQLAQARDNTAAASKSGQAASEAAEQKQRESEHEIASLKAQVVELKAKLKEVLSKLEEKVLAVVELNGNLAAEKEAAAEQAKTQRAALQQSETTVGELKAKMRQAEEAHEQHRASVEALKGGEAAMRETLQQKDEALQGKEAVIAEREAEVQRLQHEVAERKRGLEEAEVTVERLGKEGERRQKEFEERGEAMSELQRRLQELEAENARLTSELESEHKAREQGATQSDHAQRELQAKLSEVEQELQVKTASASAAAFAAEQRLLASRAEVVAAEDKRSKAVAEMTEKITILTEERDRLAAQQPQHEEQIQQHVRTLQTLHQEIEAANVSTRDAHETCRRITAERDAAIQAGQKAQAEMKAERETVRILSVSAERAETEVQRLKASAAESGGALQQLRDQLRTEQRRSTEVAAELEKGLEKAEMQSRKERQLEMVSEQRVGDVKTANDMLSRILELISSEAASNPNGWARVRHDIGTQVREHIRKHDSLEMFYNKIHTESGQRELLSTMQTWLQVRREDLGGLKSDIGRQVETSVLVKRGDRIAHDMVKVNKVLNQSVFFDPADELERQRISAETQELTDETVSVVQGVKISKIVELCGSEEIALKALQEANGDVGTAANLVWNFM